MIKTQPTAYFVFDNDNRHYQCEGNWSITSLSDFITQFKQTLLPTSETLVVSGAKLTKFDSAGALTLVRCIDELKKRDNHVELVDFNEQQRNLLSLIESKREAIDYSSPTPQKNNLFYLLGVETVFKLNQIDGLIVLVGSLSEKLFAAFAEWRRFQVPSIISNINSCGIKALPYLSGMAIFREFGPLITAIIIAGRTSSAFTAQIGSMKINEEIDALSTMGLSPVELLVVPKVIGLIIVFPLLIFWADFFGTLGAMIMSKFMLHIGYLDFTSRLQESVGVKQMMLGLYKAPAFAVLIALVGCFQGFKVEASADSVGSQTTKSVVQALFLIIIADAFFSVLYGWLDV